MSLITSCQCRCCIPLQSSHQQEQHFIGLLQLRSHQWWWFWLDALYWNVTMKNSKTKTHPMWTPGSTFVSSRASSELSPADVILIQLVYLQPLCWTRERIIFNRALSPGQTVRFQILKQQVVTLLRIDALASGRRLRRSLEARPDCWQRYSPLGEVNTEDATITIKHTLRTPGNCYSLVQDWLIMITKRS